MQLWRKHPWLLRGAALLLSAVAALVPGQWSAQIAAGVEDRVGDAFWRLGSKPRPERRVVLVDIDERSLREVGGWPWSRSTMAELASRLNSAGVRVQAYDITFADARPGDEALSRAWSESATVVAQLFSVDPTVTPAVGTLSGALETPGCPGFAPASFGYYGTSATLLTAQATIGHITPRVGSDGVVRHVPALVCHDGRAYASLALATIWRAAQPDGADSPRERQPSAAQNWQWPRGREASPHASWPAPSAWLTTPSLPGLTVPLDAQGNMRVPYGLKREAFASVSAADVLKGRTDPALLRGAIALVGATAFGMGDTIATPHGAVSSGLEVHAQALVGLLDQSTPYTPAYWPVAQGLLIGAMALLLLAAAVRRGGVPAKRLPLIGLVLAVACLAGAGVALIHFGLWLPWLAVVLFAVLASVSLATVEHAFARAQRVRLSAHLGAYVPAPTAQRLMVSDPSGSLQVEQRTISVLVADIRNFSALVTHCRPEEAAALLHSFCCIAVDVVERSGGVVENVVGDSIVAIWNASPKCADHPLRAMEAAQELVRSTSQLLASSRPVAEHSPVQPLALGIGLESGVAIVGSFGPARRRAHAALGEPVSVAKRIQEMTADLSMPILIGPQLAAMLPSEGVEPLGEYLLQGLVKHYCLFAPVGWSDLVFVDSNWARSAAGKGERQADAADWSKWGDVTRAGPPPPSLLQALITPRRRGA